MRRKELLQEVRKMRFEEVNRPGFPGAAQTDEEHEGGTGLRSGHRELLVQRHPVALRDAAAQAAAAIARVMGYSSSAGRSGGRRYLGCHA